MKPFDAAAAYRTFITDFCNGEFTLADALVSPDCLIHVAGAPDSAYLGADGFRALLQGTRAPFSSLTFSIAVGPIVQGNLLAARWHAHGIYAGGLAGAKAAPGTRVEFGGHDFFRFHGHVFVEYWGGADDGHLMSQLGMFP